MTILDGDAKNLEAKTLELPWPFTGREDELDLVRRSLAGGRRGIVVTGPVGCGRTRLLTEAVRGSDCVRVAGTPETRQIPFAAFAHLLPETVSLHRAVQLLSGTRLLLVDDAHLLDDTSAALVHQLAVHGRTRLLVAVTDGTPVPGAISRLWTGELLPRLALEPLPGAETARLLTTGADGGPEPLTVGRLQRLCQGDLRLLRDLLGAVRERGEPVPGTGEWAWRGPLPLTATVRERCAAVLERVDPGRRATLERLAFAEPLPPAVHECDLDALEQLEADGLVRVDDREAVHLARPLHGPALRAAAGRLRARRLARGPEECKAALETEASGLADAIDRADVRPLPTPVGEWLATEGASVPPAYAAVRARFSRLRGELREAAAWARDGLRGSSHDLACCAELALAEAQLGETVTGDGRGAAVPRARVVGGAVAPGSRAAGGAAASGSGAVGGAVAHDMRAAGGAVAHDMRAAGGAVAPGSGAVGGAAACASGAVGDMAASGSTAAGDAAAPAAPSAGDAATWLAVARGDLDGALETAGPYDAVRLGVPGPAGGRLSGVFAAHADALARGDGAALDRVAAGLEERGYLLFAAEAYAQAVRAHRDPRAARTSRTRAVALARRCQGARTPALSGLVLGELTARQRQIVTLAAAGLSNRQIAERLTLSIRTVGNHLYSAYARLGAGDRGCLPWLVDLPRAQPA